MAEAFQCQETGSTAGSLSTVAGVGLAGLGVYKLLSGREKRRQQLRSLKSEIELNAWSDYMKSHVVSETSDRLVENYEKLKRNFHVFQNGMQNNVHLLNQSVRNFISNSKDQIERFKQTQSTNQNAKEGAGRKKGRKLTKIAKKRASHNSKSEDIHSITKFSESDAPGTIQWNVQKIKKSPNRRVKLSIKRENRKIISI